MKSAANKSYNSVPAKALLGIILGILVRNHPKVARTLLQNQTAWNHFLKWPSHS